MNEHIQSAISILSKRFEFIETLGQGAFSSAHKVRCRLTNEYFVIKLPLNPDSVSFEQYRFDRECKSLSILDHPNIVKIREWGVAGGVPFQVFAFEESTSLRSQIATHTNDWLWGAKICLGIANALHVAHTAGILHRDIKPENVLVRPNSDPVLIDFGLAKGRFSNTVETEFGVVVGTPAYMAPELLMGQPASPESDLYSLGVLLFELAVGSCPFQGPIVKVIDDKLHSSPPRLDLSGQCPFSIQLYSIVNRLILPLSQRTPSTALDLSVLLGDAISHPVIIASPTRLSIDVSMSSGFSRSRSRVFFFSFVLLILGSFFLFVNFSMERPIVLDRFVKERDFSSIGKHVKQSHPRLKPLLLRDSCPKVVLGRLFVALDPMVTRHPDEVLDILKPIVFQNGYAFFHNTSSINSILHSAIASLKSKDRFQYEFSLFLALQRNNCETLSSLFNSLPPIRRLAAKYRHWLTTFSVDAISLSSGQRLLHEASGFADLVPQIGFPSRPNVDVRELSARLTHDFVFLCKNLGTIETANPLLLSVFFPASASKSSDLSYFSPDSVAALSQCGLSVKPIHKYLSACQKWVDAQSAAHKKMPLFENLLYLALGATASVTHDYSASSDTDTNVSVRTICYSQVRSNINNINVNDRIVNCPPALASHFILFQTNLELNDPSVALYHLRQLLAEPFGFPILTDQLLGMSVSGHFIDRGQIQTQIISQLDSQIGRTSSHLLRALLASTLFTTIGLFPNSNDVPQNDHSSSKTIDYDFFLSSCPNLLELLSEPKASRAKHFVNLFRSDVQFYRYSAINWLPRRSQSLDKLSHVLSESIKTDFAKQPLPTHLEVWLYPFVCRSSFISLPDDVLKVISLSRVVGPVDFSLFISSWNAFSVLSYDIMELSAAQTSLINATVEHFCSSSKHADNDVFSVILVNLLKMLDRLTPLKSARSLLQIESALACRRSCPSIGWLRIRCLQILVKQMRDIPESARHSDFVSLSFAECLASARRMARTIFRDSCNDSFSGQLALLNLVDMLVERGLTNDALEFFNYIHLQSVPRVNRWQFVYVKAKLFKALNKPQHVWASLLLRATKLPRADVVRIKSVHFR